MIVLKGAAYVLGQLAPARGRLFADVDILVPKAGLGHAEAQLMLHGWHSGHHDAYDQRYYRRWMHELPPMTHLRRGTSLDVHHDLLPQTARLKTRPERVIAAAQPIPGYRCLRLPRLEDLVLHAATHRFCEGEWALGLRDLTDLDALLRLGLARPDWWANLIERAVELNLAYPLRLALRYAQRLLATPVPDQVLATLARHTGRLAWGWRDALFLRGLTPAGCAPAGTGLARSILYVRGHWLRMPLHLLLPHLLYKAMRSGHSPP
ncbi:MAG: nucleotidyltransferase family protein [Thiobacillaceae bacterium]|nr:nucleotidyltransferase family protein [Thiobacillaceae bacterium]